MILIKIAPVFLLALIVGAEKKIELQDIEEDNLKSEKEKELEKSAARSQGGASQNSLPFDFLKNGLLQYFERPIQALQQPRYIHQYAVTEPPERPTAPAKPQYGPSVGPQQAMVGYLSNVPMQIYLVPQYYNEDATSAQGNYINTATTIPRVASYPTAEGAQLHNNFVEVPSYVIPTGKAFVQASSTPVTYVSYAQPTIAPAQATISPVFAYQMPVAQYQTALVSPPVLHKDYYHNPQYTESNTVETVHENEIESPKQYATQAEIPYTKPHQEYPRYYNSRFPIREEYRHGPVPELPPPNPLLLKAPPPHLAHLPKAFPMYRPMSKPVYSAPGGLHPTTFTPRPSEAYGAPYKRRPNSLLESYIPSSVQLDYLKRGYVKDPQSAYEALSSGRHFTQNNNIPRHYEGGFLPNQMYHTAAGGITYGHYKRAPKSEKRTSN